MKQRNCKRSNGVSIFMPVICGPLAAAALSLSSAACSGDGPDGAGDSPRRSTLPVATPGGSAILVAVYVDNPEGRNIYVGAVPEVPEGELDYSQFREFGDVDVSTGGGYVFLWERETATVTRFAVNESLEFEESGPKLSFFNYGSAGEGESVYVSDTRAYLLSGALDVVIVWNPTTMEIVGTIPVAPPERAAGFETFAHKGRRVGDSVIWQVLSINYDESAIYPAVTLAVASAETDEPVRYVEDDRCVGANGGHVDDQGNYYVRADAYWGQYAAYGAEAASMRTCVLRIRAGEAAFDPDYMMDMKELTGSYVNFPWFHVVGSQYVAQAWNSALPLPEEDDYFSSNEFLPLLVDVESGGAQPYPDLAGTVMVQSAERSVDGVAYYELSDVGYVGLGNRADIVELRPEGIVRKFSVPSLWALARIR